MIFLIEYDRTAEKILRFERFEDAERSRAEDSRLEIELSLNRDGIDHEVILLQATSEEALHRTHRRYFETLPSIAKSTGKGTA
jgi:hypothetical protein